LISENKPLKTLATCDILNATDDDTTARGGVSMANEEHLKILEQGAKAWNQWREENPDVRPDLTWADLWADRYVVKFSGADLNQVEPVRANLSEANLSEANLSGATLIQAQLRSTNLREANLTWANLREADLGGADLARTSLDLTNLSGAHLFGAHLKGAILSGTNLSEANLSEATLIQAQLRSTNLREADLSGADLGGANLSEADLGGANLSEAKLRGTRLFMAHLKGANLGGALVGRTTFEDLDLSEVKGLETVRHAGPSTIGVDTIYRSKGKIPEAFLRGCGVQEDFITYMGSLTSKAFEYYSCFVSYSSKDESFARRLHADLQDNAVRCWFAPEDMKIGDDIWNRIDQTIRVYDKLLVVLSEHSINSAWVKDEVETAFEEERKRDQTILFPVMLDETVMGTEKSWAAKIRRRHIGDFSQWKDHASYQQAFDRLLRDLKADD
jgi:uncharacterized protein YjbI with pentapeptide repeats